MVSGACRAHSLNLGAVWGKHLPAFTGLPGAGCDAIVWGAPTKFVTCCPVSTSGHIPQISHPGGFSKGVGGEKGFPLRFRGM